MSFHLDGKKTFVAQLLVSHATSKGHPRLRAVCAGMRAPARGMTVMRRECGGARQAGTVSRCSSADASPALVAESSKPLIPIKTV